MPAAIGCGRSEREEAEQAVRSHEAVAGDITSVRCERAERVWGCRVRLADGRTQACQVSTGEAADPPGVACQPLRGE